ncbi:MAG: DUF4209 domain-containing protein [Planctomycetota bacterium]
MSGARFPADLEVAAEHFTNSGWREAIDGAKREGYSAMSHALTGAARKAILDDRTPEGKVLWLLSDACSMMLKPENHNEPFKPSIVMSDGSRSALPEDFTDADIVFFDAILEHVDEPWLKGRLADILWLRHQPRNPDHALAAIDAYRSLALDTQTWVCGSCECWGRAISLSKIMGTAADVRRVEMGDAVLAAFNGTTVEDGFLALWLSDLIAEHGLVAKEHVQGIAEKLEQLAGEHDAKGELPKFRDYYERAARWYQWAKDKAKSAEMTVALAESWVSEAEFRASAGRPGYMVAANFYEKAIQVYRSVTRDQREAHKVDERMVELRQRLSEAGELSLGEMGVISAPPTDITEMIKDSIDAVRGNDPEQALHAFVGLFRIEAKALRDLAVETIKEHPLAGLFPAAMISREGRVIAKNAGMSLDGSDAEADEAGIWTMMLQNYGLTISMTAQGSILPAQEILMQEHRLREADFEWLASRSPLIPRDRTKMWGAALYAGYNQDYLTAIHLLCPQVEHCVRVQIKNHGVTTTSLDEKGIENEIGLSALMKLDKVDEIFPPDLAFEIRALFCDSVGSNLRNDVAHGLITYTGCFSAPSIYAWWFCLRLVFVPYWNAKKRAEAAADNEATSPD